jgi:uncharacterized protein (DUF1810 family)
MRHLRREVMSTNDVHDLNRFVEAQRSAYERALAELRSGRKRSHWMWYIFPQLAGLGHSTMSRQYAIAHAEEAKAYLDHALLGPRLIECATAVLETEGRSACEIFGSPDDLKLHSSATLFGRVSPPGSVFSGLLAKYFGGREDEQTVRLLGARR